MVPALPVRRFGQPGAIVIPSSIPLDFNPAVAVLFRITRIAPGRGAVNFPSFPGKGSTIPGVNQTGTAKTPPCDEQGGAILLCGSPR